MNTQDSAFIEVEDIVGTWRILERKDNTKLRINRGTAFKCQCINCGIEKMYTENTLRRKKKPPCQSCKKNIKPLTRMSESELKDWQGERDKIASIQNNGCGKDRRLVKFIVNQKGRIF